MELIKNFGIDPFLLGAQVVNFLIVLLILRRFLYKPIIKVLQKRQDTIKEGLKNAEEANKRLEVAIQEEKNILRKAQIQAKELIMDAKNASLESVQKADLQTKAYTNRLILEARQQIAIETKDAEKRITIHVSKLAIDFLQKSLSQLFTEQDQETVMKNAVRKFQKRII